MIHQGSTDSPRPRQTVGVATTTHTLDDYLNRLQRVVKSGEGYKALCPAHDDHHPSLSIDAGKNGRPILHCHAGCSYEAIIAAMGMDRPDTRQVSTKRKIVATYDYVDEQGMLLRQKVRFEPKDFLIRCPDGNGGWIWKKGDGRPVLYRLPELLQAIATSNATVFMPEGEKDADRVHSLGLVVTTNIEGASKDTQRQKWLKEYNQQLAGVQRLVLLPDADPQGRARVQHIAKELVGGIPDIRIVPMPDGFKDVSDWLNAGHSVAELLQLVEATEPYHRPADTEPTDFEPLSSEESATPEESDIARKVRRLFEMAIDPIDLDQSLKALAKETGTPVGLLREQARTIRRQLKKAKGPKPKGNGKDSSAQGQAQAAEHDHPPIQFKATSKGTPKAIVFNALQVLRHDPRWQGVFGYDEFAECAMLLRRPPYDHRTMDWTPRPLQDSDDIETADWMQGEFDLPVSSGIVAEATQVAARYNRYHPVRDFLNSLTWDETPRLDTWIIRHFGAADNDYIKAVSSKSLISAVARIFRPGCKADTVAILDGPQGYLKSTAWRILAGDEWFTDHMPDLHSKDAMQQLSGKWIIELAELSALNRSDIESNKRFISAVQDDFRPSYGRRRVTRPRQCVFVGTTNETCYLKDSTGNRRFWPVTITKRCDITKLKEERNQLLAEAVHRFRQGERWHLTGKLEQQAAEEQASRIEPDAWEPLILTYLEARPDLTFITSGDILAGALEITKTKDWLPLAEKRVSSIMKRAGWKHMNKRVCGIQTKGFLRPILLPPDPPEQPPPGSATDATGSDNHATDSSNSENSNNINHVTDATDATAPIEYRQQTATNIDNNAGTSNKNNRDTVPLWFKESTGSSGNTGNIVDSAEELGVTTHVTDSGSGNSGSTPPDFGASDDGYWQSMPEYQPGATASRPEPGPPAAATTTTISIDELFQEMAATVLKDATGVDPSAEELERVMARIRPADEPITSAQVPEPPPATGTYTEEF